MNLNITDKERYVPDIEGNLKDEKPMAFNLRFFSVKEQDEIEYYENVSTKGRIRLKNDFSTAFLLGVESIENCVINGKEIKTAQEYLDIRRSTRLTNIMHDVVLHLKSASEIDEKN